MLIPFRGNASIWASASNPRETIFVHTDRDIYVAGEHLFFDLRLFTEPAIAGRTSAFAYIALRSEKGLVKRISLKVDKGQGHGQIYLPDTLSSGYYELIAFTNWMRNAGEEWYFKKPLFIANRFDNNLEATLPPFGEPHVHFFPEGGNLSEGINNSILLVASGPFDASLRNVNIFTNTGDTIHQLKLNAHGWGLFELIPQDTIDYFASIDGADKIYKLPPTLSRSVSLKVIQKNNQLLIKVSANAENLKAGNIVIYQGGKAIHTFSTDFGTENTAELTIPLANLPANLLHIQYTLSGSQPIASRYWYNATDISALSLSAPSTLKKREKLELEIKGNTTLMDGLLAISMVREEALQPASVDLGGWQLAMQLAEELSLEPGKALALFGSLSPNQVNQRLGGVSKQNFMFKEGPVRNAFFMETQQQIVSGRVNQIPDETPLQGVRIILNAPDSIVNLLYTRTNHQGEFQFLLDEYYNNRELVFTPDPETFSGQVEIEIFDKFRIEKPFEPVFFPGLAQRKDYILQAQEVVKVNKAFEVNHIGPSLVPPRLVFNAPRLFSRPVSVVRTGDYAPLSNLQEIARELVLTWRIRQSGSRISHVLVGANDRKQLSGTPVLFIDGVIAFEIRPLLNLGSKEIREIQVQNLEWMHGEMSFAGIVALFTHEASWKNLRLNPAPKVVFNEAYRNPGRFIAPTYQQGNTQKQLPDLRNLLYWNPEVSIDRTGKSNVNFFTGDLSGNYVIKIQGIDKSGKAIIVEQTITVQP